MRFFRPAAAAMAAVAAAVAAGTLAMGGPASARPLAAAGATAPAAQSGTWGKAHAVPGLAALGKGTLSSTVNQVSCPRPGPGNCAAVGFYVDSGGNDHPFLAEEKHGTWGNARRVPGLSSLNKRGASASAVSCVTPGDCTVAGSVIDARGRQHVFAASEKHGTWGTAREIGFGRLDPGGNQLIRTLSCVVPGDCAMSGSYIKADGIEEPFVAGEKNGTWGTAIEVPGVGAANAGGRAKASSMSCLAADACSVGGFYTDGKLRVHPFVADESGGKWGRFRDIAVPAGIADVNERVVSLSCVRPGYCALTGTSGDFLGRGQVFVADRVGGTWGVARPVPGSVGLNTGDHALAGPIACAAPGDCATGGTLSDPRHVAYVADERGGVWTSARLVSGGAFHDFDTTVSASITAMSCALPGNCAAAGFYYAPDKTTRLAFVVNEVNGSWGHAIRLPGPSTPTVPADIFSVACALPGNCAAGGDNGSAAFIADQSTARKRAVVESH